MKSLPIDKTMVLKLPQQKQSPPIQVRISTKVIPEMITMRKAPLESFIKSPAESFMKSCPQCDWNLHHGSYGPDYVCDVYHNA